MSKHTNLPLVGKLFDTLANPKPISFTVYKLPNDHPDRERHEYFYRMSLSNGQTLQGGKYKGSNSAGKGKFARKRPTVLLGSKQERIQFQQYIEVRGRNNYTEYSNLSYSPNNNTFTYREQLGYPLSKGDTFENLSNGKIMRCTDAEEGSVLTCKKR